MTNRHLSKKNIIFLSLLLIFIVAGMAYYRYLQLEHVKAEEVKLDLERKNVSERMREGGKQLAEQLRLHPIRLQEDPFAEPEPSDTDELAQARLWHKTPPAQRAKIFPDKQTQE